MLLQEAMIERARDLCTRDERVVAALLYGSFATGEGDAYSDVELACFIRDEDLAGFDERAWVAQLAPVDLYFDDDFGHHTAIFADLVRGEFHFEPASRMAQVESWQGNAHFPSLAACALVDRTGELTRRLAPLLVPPGDRGAGGRAQALLDNFANVVLFGANVLARGEAARSLEIMGLVHRYLLFMLRLREDQTAHWPTPSRGLEQDIAPADYARYARCCAPLDAAALWQAYRWAWNWGLELAEALRAQYGATLPAGFAGRMGEHLQALEDEQDRREDPSA